MQNIVTCHAIEQEYAHNGQNYAFPAEQLDCFMLLRTYTPSGYPRDAISRFSVSVTSWRDMWHDIIAATNENENWVMLHIGMTLLFR